MAMVIITINTNLVTTKPTITVISMPKVKKNIRVAPMIPQCS